MHARTTLRAALFGCKFTSMKGARDDAGSKSNLNGGAISFEAFCSCVLAVVNPRGGASDPGVRNHRTSEPGRALDERSCLAVVGFGSVNRK